MLLIEIFFEVSLVIVFVLIWDGIRAVVFIWACHEHMDGLCPERPLG